MKKFLSKISFRSVIQILIVALIFSLALIHQKLGIEKAAPIDAYCPFGAVESFFTLVFKGEFLKRIFTSSFILLGIFFIATLFLGRIFCGYFCPLGALQEWIRFLGRKIGIKKDFEVPEKIDKYLRYVKYFILVLIVYFSFYLGDLVFRLYDPYNALMHFGAEFDEKIIGYGILLLVLVGSLFSKNLWCRYFCPLGAFFGIIKKFSFLRIKRNSDTCISCGLCDQKCPANLKIQSAKKIDDVDCISCGICISNCPEGSLGYIILNKKISKKLFSILVIFLVIIPLLIVPYTSFWKTKADSNILDIQGEVNADDIRGSNTLDYLIKTTKVPLVEFQKKLNIPSEVDVSLKLKEIGSVYDIKNSEGNILETEDFRKVVRDYLERQNAPKENKELNKIETDKRSDCSFGEVDCEFPGDCGSYIDINNDGVCDHS